jgi:urea transport system permease protein
MHVHTDTSAPTPTLPCIAGEGGFKVISSMRNSRCLPLSRTAGEGRVRVFLFLSFLFLFVLPSPHALAADTFESQLQALATTNFKQKEAALTELGQSRHGSTKAVLQALLEGKLYYRREDKKVVIATAEEPLTLADPVTLKAIGAASSDDYARITTNNQLRKSIKALIAAFDLGDADAAIRLNAVKEMLRSIDEDTVALLRERMTTEKDSDVQEAMKAGVALYDLSSPDAGVRLAAVDMLQESLNPDVYNRLQTLTERAEDGTYNEPDIRVRARAIEVVESIETRRTFYGGLETLFFGLSLGSVLVLAAIGLAITFGVMGVINMAHGELMMLGAYTTYVMQLLMPQHIGISIVIAIPVAFLVSGAMGVLIERSVVRFLYGRPLETLLATFGISLLLQQLVRDIFTANNRPVETPAWMSGSLQINDAFSITYNRLYVIIFTLAVFGMLLALLSKTSLGLKVRAVAQNRAMAKSMGVRTEWVDAMTFGLGSGIAGVAGVALSQLTNVGPNLGQQYIIDSFMVVVFGGVGNLWGTLIGGMSLGVVNKLLEPSAGAVLAKIFVLIALILFIQRRPRGLFPQKGRAAEA